jgi:type I restriction enzyme S subunit
VRARPYPRYKDADIEWLEQVPAHWQAKPLKRLTAFSTGWTPPTGREEFYGGEHLWANISDLGPRVLTSTEKTITDAAVKEARLRSVDVGSLLFSFKLSVGAVSIAGAPMFTNEAIAAFAPSQSVFTPYLYWAAPVFISHNAQENIYGAPLLSRERIANARLLCLSIPEQQTIADFLDRETAKIDALVEKKERLVELLQEKRSALITHAVTKGLDPNVPMKDSGIERLGQIPAHWEVRRMKRLAGKIGSGKTPRGGAESYVAEGAMLIRSQNVRTGALDLDDVVFIDEATDREMADTRVREGDVLLNITGASLGRCCVARLQGGDANVNQHVCIVRPRPRVSESSYLAYEVMSPVVQCQIFETQMGISRDAVNFEQIGDLQLATPPQDEQCAIAEALDRETGKITALTAKVQEAIERLKEYRTALISAAVTGKIDVRGL